MAITYPLTMPAAPAPRGVEWVSESSVAVSRSGFTFKPQAYDWGGKVRHLQIDFPPMSLEDAKVWQAWILKLNGREGTFYFSDTIGKSGQGTVNGTPLVDGASQTTQALVTDGWSTGDSVKAGDWISIADNLYTILSDASESTGAMTLDIWPDARTPADNATISYGEDARGVFRLDEFPSFEWTADQIQGPITMTATEEI